MGEWELATAAAITGGVALGWKLACTSLLPRWLGLGVADSRKLMHIAVVAAAVPALMSAQFAAVGLGLLRDDSLVAAVSRGGRRRELLLGPLQYGVAHTAVALLCWRSSLPGVMALACLCAGDGLAEMVGRRAGHYLGALPHNRSKTWVGTAAFVVGSSVGGAAILSHFSHCAVINLPPLPALLPCVLWTSVAAAAVETLPLTDCDNVSVPSTALLVAHLLCT